MEIKRFDGTNEILVFKIEGLCNGSLIHRELNGDHYAKLIFNLDSPVYLQVGDFVDLDYGRFELIEPYIPTLNVKTGGYEYEIKLYAYYFRWQNKLLRYSPESSYAEVSFKLTSTIDTHLNLVLTNLDMYGELDKTFLYNGETKFQYSVDNDLLADAKYVYYDNLSIYSAIETIAKTWDTEWWVEDNVIHLGKCNLGGTEVEFDIDINVNEMTRSTSESDYATRLLAFGSTKNLNKQYRRKLNNPFTINRFSFVYSKTVSFTVHYLEKDNANTGFKYTRDNATWYSPTHCVRLITSEEEISALAYEFTVLEGNYSSNKTESAFNDLLKCTFQITLYSFSVEDKEADGIKYVNYVQFINDFDEMYSKFGVTAWSREKHQSFSFKDLELPEQGVKSTSSITIPDVLYIDTGKIIQTVNSSLTYKFAYAGYDVYGGSSSVDDGKDNVSLNTFYITDSSVQFSYIYTENGNFLSKGGDVTVENVALAHVSTLYTVPVDGSENVTINGSVIKRLMIPLLDGEVQINPELDVEVKLGGLQIKGLSESEIVEAVYVNEDIYPKEECTITKVETYKATETGDDGITYEQTFYRITISEFEFDSSYILEGETLHVLFQSGSLNGMDFECEYSDSQGYFEIIVNEDYGRELPDDILYPVVGDKVIIYNWDIDAFGDSGLIEKAEYELLEDAIKQLEKLQKDPFTYTCTMQSDWVEKTDYIEYSLGQPVKLICDAYFKDGRSSRIIGYEIKLDIPYDAPQYIVGESAKYSTTKDLQNQIDSIVYGGETYASSGSGGSGIYLIKYSDNTKATDTNAYSSLRSDKNYLSRLYNDTAQGLIKFSNGLQTGAYVELTQGSKIEASGNAELGNVYLRNLLNTLEGVVRSLIGTPVFVNGFDGEGWQIWKDDNDITYMTLDNLTVRQSMVIYELIIQKVRAVGGQLLVSAATGKIATVEEDDDYYYISFEDDNEFVVGDLMRCQTWTGRSIKHYWVEVASVEGSIVAVSKSEFNGQTYVDVEGNKVSLFGIPEVGDEVVLMGNVGTEKGGDDNRQNMISICATQDGQPRIDILNGVNKRSLAGALRARLGNLNGIYDSWFGENQPQGDGLYANNAYLRGHFLIKSGDNNYYSVFEIADDKIEAAVEGLRSEFADSDSWLTNAAFGYGIYCWNTNNDTTFYYSTEWVWANEGLLSTIKDGAYCGTDNGYAVMHIINSSICQRNEDMKGSPTITESSEGIKIPATAYVTVRYKCVSSGTLTMYFKNEDNIGFQGYEKLDVSVELLSTDGEYKTYSTIFQWSGIGDFYLSFTGDIYIDVILLSDDSIDVLLYKYATFFEMSDKLIELGALAFDSDGNLLLATTLNLSAAIIELEAKYFDAETGELKNKSGLVTTADFSTLFAEAFEQEEVVSARLSVFVKYATDDDGNFKIDDQGYKYLESGVLVKADNIRLEGYTTINENFKVDENGKLIAVDGDFSGKLNSTEGNIGGFEISSDVLESHGSDKNYQGVYRESLSLKRTGISFFRSDEDSANDGNLRVNVLLSSNGVPGTQGGVLYGAPLFLQVSYTPGSGANVGIYTEVEGAKKYDDVLASGNFALYNASGMIGGLRPLTRTFDSSSTLSTMDCIVITSTEDITISLPSSAEVCQLYIFLPSGKQAFYVKVTNSNEKIYEDTLFGSSYTTYTVASTRMVILVKVNSTTWLIREF